MVGEAWPVIAGKGPAFQDYNNPLPVVQVGSQGSVGNVEITDIIFSTIGPCQCLVSTHLPLIGDSNDFSSCRSHCRGVEYRTVFAGECWYVGYTHQVCRFSRKLIQQSLNEFD
jgi:hypothetical protein